MASEEVIQQNCTHCSGNGEVWVGPDNDDWDTCMLCGGDKLIPTAEKIIQLRESFRVATGDLQAAAFQSQEQESELTRLREENERLKGENNIILSSLTWSGDGYDWTPATADYRMRISDAVALMERDRKDMQAKLDAAEKRVEEMTESCQQGKQRAQNFLDGLTSDGPPQTLAGISCAAMVASLQNDFIEALDPNAFKEAALTQGESK